MMTSRVAAIKTQITQEYLAGQLGLFGLAVGVSQHRYLTAKTERIGTLQQELHSLVGEQATALVAETLATLPEEPTRAGLLSVLQHEFGKSEETAVLLDYIQDMWETQDLLIRRLGKEQAQRLINAPGTDIHATSCSQQA